MRTDRLQHEFGIEIRWSVFPLHPEVPPEGTELSRLLRVEDDQLHAMQARLHERALAEGLAISERSRTYNSRNAQELGKWAEEAGKGEPWRRAVFQAFFVETRNIALADELAAIAQSVGLSPAEARVALAEGRYAAAVEADWERARHFGISAVPSHLYAGRRLVGFTDYGDFLRLIGKN